LNDVVNEPAGGVFTAKQAPHRPGIARALGLRAEAEKGTQLI